MSKFFLHVETFQHWLDNFELVCFDVESEDMSATKEMLTKLTNNQDIDQVELELLYALSLDNATLAKNDFIKFQAKTITNFLNSDIFVNVIRE